MVIVVVSLVVSAAVVVDDIDIIVALCSLHLIFYIAKLYLFHL